MNLKRFKNLRHLNLILTNACNKKCDYCFEQHDKIYENFTVKSLKRAYSFLAEVNDHDEKYFQFFGGEPLLQKDLILEFLKEHKKEIENHSDIRISVITNGTLLTEDFIQEYCSYPNTQIMVSLDSHIENFGQRHCSEEEIEKVLQNCVKVIEQDGDLTIRCTLSKEGLPHLKEYFEVLKFKGIKSMVMHPLTMDATNGYIEWTDEEWDQLKSILKDAIYDDEFTIHFSEGVGERTCDTNCMVGSSMIAMDGSGDYSGCYFFTNQKAALPQTLLGNIFTGEIHEDRYDDFANTYTEHFAKDEKCHTCELENYCYQCPAGNLTTGTPMFRSDSMCKKIVGLFLTLRRDENRKKFFKLSEKIKDAYGKEGPIVLSRAVFQLAYRLETGSYVPFDTLGKLDLPNHLSILGYLNSYPKPVLNQPEDSFKAEVEEYGMKLFVRDFIKLRYNKDTGQNNELYNIAALHFIMSPGKQNEKDADTDNISGESLQ